MAFGQFNDTQKHGGAPLRTLSEINVTPLVDVMLVLLVIFIITAPLLTHAIKLELPQASVASQPEAAAAIRIAVDADGKLYWDKEMLSFAELKTRFARAAQQGQAPEVQLRADKSTRYEILAQVMAAAQAQGLHQIAFVTEGNNRSSLQSVAP